MQVYGFSLHILCSYIIVRGNSSNANTSLMSAAMCRADNGVCSAGLITTVFPQHRAGAIFHANIITGKFHCKPKYMYMFELQQHEELVQLNKY